jgi:hypothetical protein
MKSIWIPGAPGKSFLEIEDSPFAKLPRQTRAQLNEGRAQPAAERRSELPGFVETFSWEGIRSQLPLQVPGLEKHPTGQAVRADPIING